MTQEEFSKELQAIGASLSIALTSRQWSVEEADRIALGAVKDVAIACQERAAALLKETRM